MAYAVMLPSKSRPNYLRRLFRMCPSLNVASTFVGLERAQERDYQQWRRENSMATIVWVDNPLGTPGPAREQIRRAAISVGYDTYVFADDDMIVKADVIAKLVDAHERMTAEVGPTAMAAMHTIHKLFEADRIEFHSRMIGPYRIFPKVSFMLWVVDTGFLEQYTYPEDSGAIDDVYTCFAAIQYGVTEWWVCTDAPFGAEPRWSEGGMGDEARRIVALGHSISRIATDFPEWVTKDCVATKFKFDRIIEIAKHRKGVR